LRGIGLKSVWIKHNSHLSSHGSSRQVLSECADDLSIVSVGGPDLTPDHSEFGVVLFVAGLVNVTDLLAKVPLGGLVIVDALDVY